MRRLNILLSVLLCIGGVTAFGQQGYNESLLNVENTHDYRQAVLEYELEALRAERAAIQAQNELARLQAEQDGLSAEIAFLSVTGQVRAAVVEAGYAVELAHRARELADDRLEYARNRRSQARVQYDRGQAPLFEFLEANLAVRSAEMEKEQSDWVAEDAEASFVRLWGSDWHPGLMRRPVDPGTAELDTAVSPDGSLQLGIQRAELRSVIARVRREMLPSNAPSFDIRIADAEVEKTGFALERVESDAHRDAAVLVRRVISAWERVLIRRDELGIRQDLYSEAEFRHERGMISAAALSTAAQQVVQGRIQLLQAEQEYWTARIEYGVAAGTLFPDDA